MKSAMMSRALFVSLALAGACKKQEPTPTPAPAPRPEVVPLMPTVKPAAAEPAPAAPAAAVIGMEEPFARMTPTAVKMLDAGFKLLRKKKYPEARQAFHDVVVAYPDNTSVRFQELRAAALAGDLGDVPGLWRELLARDFVGYAGSLDQAKELAPLRKSPYWAELKIIKGESKAAYAAGLGRGVLFVARARSGAAPRFDDETNKAKLDPSQEVYHFDPASQRYRRLTDTGGHVIAIHHDTQRGQLIALLGRSLTKTQGAPAFEKPEAVLVSLATLERSGPIAIEADATAVELCFSSKGEPVWTVSAVGANHAKALTLDATGTALVALDEACSAKVATTSVGPRGIEHRRPDPEGVALSKDGMQLEGVDADKPVRASQAIRPGSFSWSPGKKRFAYTGNVDRCDLASRLEQDQKPAPNAVYVWDAEQKKAARVTSAVTAYETEWLDDDHLAYEAGLDRAPRLAVHDFTGGGALVVDAPAGAGLYGMPALGCFESEVHALAN
jgi:hypothetical protein